MSDVWDTKDGRRRVRRDPADAWRTRCWPRKGLTDDSTGRSRSSTSLMEVSVEEAAGAVLRLGQRKDVSRFTIAGRTGAPRAVVVERRRAPRARRAADG